MDQNDKIDQATEDLARSLYHAAKIKIKADRTLVRDIEYLRKKYGWKFGQQN